MWRSIGKSQYSATFIDSAGGPPGPPRTAGDSGWVLGEDLLQLGDEPERFGVPAWNTLRPKMRPVAPASID